MPAGGPGRPVVTAARAGGVAVLLALVLALVLGACDAEQLGGALGDGSGAGGPGAPPPGATSRPPRDVQRATVLEVVDGDTVELRGSGKGPLRPGSRTTARLLEVDTPETKLGVECYGREAAAFTRRLLAPGSTVLVAPDRELRDRYGRTLLYVWTAKGVFANQELIRTGHATAVLYQPNDRYINLMRRTEAAARSKRLGLWGRCGGNPPNRPRGSTGGQDGRIQPSGPGQAAPSGRNTCPASHPVKGNVGQNGKIYHVPGSRDYRRTNPELCFADEAAARAAGFRRAG
jgi:micrococcal nuclease